MLARGHQERNNSQRKCEIVTGERIVVVKQSQKQMVGEFPKEATILTKGKEMVTVYWRRRTNDALSKLRPSKYAFQKKVEKKEMKKVMGSCEGEWTANKHRKVETMERKGRGVLVFVLPAWICFSFFVLACGLAISPL